MEKLKLRRFGNGKLLKCPPEKKKYYNKYQNGAILAKIRVFHPYQNGAVLVSRD
jgi:hypothetical protein